MEPSQYFLLRTGKEEFKYSSLGLVTAQEGTWRRGRRKQGKPGRRMWEAGEEILTQETQTPSAR